MTAADLDPIDPLPPGPTVGERPERGINAGAIVAGVLLLVLGVTWFVDAAGLADIRAAVVLPALLVGVGIGMMAVSPTGSHPGLAVLGGFLVVVSMLAAIGPPEALRGGIGERRHVVVAEADLRSDYEVGLGQLVLDLRQLELTGRRSVQVSVGAGDVTVLLPEGLPVSAEAEVGAGEIDLLGSTDEGVAATEEFRSEGFADADARLELRVELGAGRVEVTREEG